MHLLLPVVEHTSTQPHSELPGLFCVCARFRSRLSPRPQYKKNKRFTCSAMHGSFSHKFCVLLYVFIVVFVVLLLYFLTQQNPQCESLIVHVTFFVSSTTEKCSNTEHSIFFDYINTFISTFLSCIISYTSVYTYIESTWKRFGIYLYQSEHLLLAFKKNIVDREPRAIENSIYYTILSDKNPCG